MLVQIHTSIKTLQVMGTTMSFLLYLETAIKDRQMKSHVGLVVSWLCLVGWLIVET